MNMNMNMNMIHEHEHDTCACACVCHAHAHAHMRMHMYAWRAHLRPVPAELDARVERDAESRRPRRAPERGGRVAAEHAAAKDGREG